MHLFLEEAEEILPQEPERGEERMIHEFKRIWKLGRNFGIGGSLISQRPQEILKKALNLTELLFAFQMTGPHERKAVGVWISEKGLDQDIAADLPKLPIGVCHLWSPSWLQVSETIKISQKWTFDASSTPKIGTARKQVKLAEINLDEISEQMKATVERAKENDPAELKRQIALLKREQGRKMIPIPAPAWPAEAKIKEVKVLTNAERGRITSLIATLEKICSIAEDGVRKAAQLGSVRKQFEPEIQFLRAALSPIKNGAPTAVSERPLPVRAAALPGSAYLPVTRVTKHLWPSGKTSAEIVSEDQPDGEFTPAPRHQALINALAFFESIGQKSIKKNRLAAFVGRSNDGGYRSDLSVLRTPGVVDYPGPSEICLTEHGHKFVSGVPDIQTQDDLHKMWLRRLPPRQSAILKLLIEHYPAALNKTSVAEAIGRTNDGGFRSDLSVMRTLGTIDYPRSSEVIASENLYPEIPD